MKKGIINRTTAILLLIAVFCISLAGCGKNNSAANENNAVPGLADGTYTVDVKTDSTMFHLNEASKSKGTLTVKNGQMTVHITLASKSIVNLFYGKAEDAKKDGAKLIEPTTDKVTYSDGITEEAFGFDIPVPKLGEEFEVAIIGTHGDWYDHKIIVTNPEPVK